MNAMVILIIHPICARHSNTHTHTHTHTKKYGGA